MRGSFEQYLLDEYQGGKIDFHMRVNVGVDGHPTFYIHPQGKAGTTTDFVVLDNCLVARQVFAAVGGIV